MKRKWSRNIPMYHDVVTAEDVFVYMKYLEYERNLKDDFMIMTQKQLEEESSVMYNEYIKVKVEWDKRKLKYGLEEN